MTPLPKHIASKMTNLTLMDLTALMLLLLNAAVSINYGSYHVYSNLDPSALIFCASFTSAVLPLSLLLRYRSKSSAPTYSGPTSKHCLLATLCRFITWTAGFTAIYYMNPAAALAIAISTPPIITALTHIKKLSHMSMITGLLILTTAMLSTSTSSGLQCTIHDDYQLEIGVFFSILCGISLHLGTKISTRLNKLGHSSLKTDALASALTFAICAAIGFANDSFFLMLANADQLIVFSIFFLLPTQIALWFAMKNIDIQAVAIGVSAIPLCTLLVQVTLFQLSVDPFMALFVAGNALALIVMSCKKYIAAQAGGR